MLARISTTFDCTPEQLWEEIRRLASLCVVAATLLRFDPLVPGGLDSDWVVGKTYPSGKICRAAKHRRANETN